ncbi:nitroreductase family protein [Lactococcus formosensis]|uniref:nitroreductase family protein n=1 Tax=Lactococcus formosensis TaxID=1281486 RepID=UPI002434D8EE|nr:nitroreductase family protein [Lactococcus formosensis]MDG6126198.1 nitroreductase family protein [Lactococcus formosensis]MDG6187489.1 nitroreductase family protein [Lactococcus formosensis]
MNETIDLMMQHSSVRNFTDEKIPEHVLKIIINAGRAAPNWKNFQSYSVVLVESQEQKDAIFAQQPQKAIKNCAAFLVFVGDLNRAKTAVEMNGGIFQPEGVESLLITSVDAAVAGQNTLLAAQSLGYGGVMVGLIRDQAHEISEILSLPDYTYPIFAVALGKPARVNLIKPRLPYEAVVFPEKYIPQDEKVLRNYDKVQDDYAGARRLNSTWSSRMVDQWGQPEQRASTENLKEKGLL